MRTAELVIIGGGSAGLSAAIEARKQGIQDILVLERSSYLGGILRQCIHNGFGVHKYKEDLTGVEFAKRIADEARALDIPCLQNTFALDISPEKVITAMNPTDGLFEIQAKAIILAMGCRERPRGALMIPGSRCAGILTAGTAQRYLNLEGYMPGKKIVILGSGDIGLIMARQFVIEGATVERVVEIMPYSSGLARNISQCLNDFDIPISYNSTVIQIKGKGRVQAVTVAQVDENRRPVPGTEFDIACDSLIISAGLIPENELTKSAGIQVSGTTKGAVVDDQLMTSLPGVFSCGNVLHVHDLVDHVSAEGTRAGANAARYLKEGTPSGGAAVPVEDGFGVNGAVPQFVHREGGEKVDFMFRPRGRYTNCKVCVDVDGKCVRQIPKMVLTPGEMCNLTLDRSLLSGAADKITLRVEV
ncbi:NAD(P)/FAD-dependent oxidoreductase [uncultured Intestinimonas sp.]|uniref:NAD(P)/FAD-dependent oxidoreductase n=1 Tax=uncultured Intestinimonas sp. TaxID=1689265 RepID=UPI0025F56F8D|nr:NAD(P)/FAD-dependent oxidoreductase [uncultured Intestinimonas sp.]